MFTSVAPPLMLNVACEGDEHELVWVDGRVVLTNHPDLDAELALVAFGGAEPACLSYLRCWEDAVADGGFLAEWVEDTALTPAWLSWLGMALDRMRVEGFHEVLRALPPSRSLRMGEFIYRFPLPWLDRAAAAVSESLATGVGATCANAPRHLNGATAVRLRRAFVTSLGERNMALGAAALVPLKIDVADGAPLIIGSLVGQDRGVTITVAPTWLHTVWAAGAATIDGHLVLALTPSVLAPTNPRRAIAVVAQWTKDSRSPTLTEIDVAHDGARWVHDRYQVPTRQQVD